MNSFYFKYRLKSYYELLYEPVVTALEIRDQKKLKNLKNQNIRYSNINFSPYFNFENDNKSNVNNNLSDNLNEKKKNHKIDDLLVKTMKFLKDNKKTNKEIVKNLKINKKNENKFNLKLKNLNNNCLSNLNYTERRKSSTNPFINSLSERSCNSNPFEELIDMKNQIKKNKKQENIDNLKKYNNFILKNKFTFKKNLIKKNILNQRSEQIQNRFLYYNSLKNENKRKLDTKLSFSNDSLTKNKINITSQFSKYSNKNMLNLKEKIEIENNSNKILKSKSNNKNNEEKNLIDYYLKNNFSFLKLKKKKIDLSKI